MRSLFFVLSLLVFSKLTHAYPLKVLTFNAWLLPFVASDIPERTRAMAGSIFFTGADIVALQEVWSDSTKIQIASDLARWGYRYSTSTPRNLFTPHGFLGNGLLIASKYPLGSEVRSLIFSNNVRFEEYFAAKGAILTSVVLPEVGEISLFNAHLGTVSFNMTSQTYNFIQRAAQQTQIQELRNFLFERARAPLVIGCLDGNFHHEEWSPSLRRHLSGVPSANWRELTALSGLQDTYHWIHNSEPYAAMTCDYDNNSNNASQCESHQPNEYLDYVLVTAAQNSLRPTTSSIVLREPILSTGRPLSDHYGVMTTFEVHGNR